MNPFLPDFGKRTVCSFESVHPSSSYQLFPNGLEKVDHENLEGVDPHDAAQGTLFVAPIFQPYFRLRRTLTCTPACTHFKEMAVPPSLEDQLNTSLAAALRRPELLRVRSYHLSSATCAPKTTPPDPHHFAPFAPEPSPP